jgi:O-antigen/teichoic acid export membrane protein
MADDIFDKSISFAMFISTSICIGIMTVSKEFVPLFFGIGFDKCNTLFAIILPSCIFLAFANVIRTQYLLPRKRDVVYVLSLFSGAIVNLVANLVLIPRYASVGAAIGTLAAEITVCVFQSVSVLKEARIGKNILKSLPFIISGVIMFVTCHNYAPKFDNRVIGLLFKILISGGVYIAVLGVMISIRLLRNKRIYR